MQAHTTSFPRHVGIILDGNRRWARQRGLPTFAGHLHGYQRVISIGEYALKKGIQYLTLFVFSTENWNRSKREVSYLMHLFLEKIKEQTVKLHEKGICLRVIGSRAGLSKPLVRDIQNAERLTDNNKKGTLIMAFNYGGRREIIDAVKKMIADKQPAKKISESLIKKYLYAPDIPEPDLIIRTSGEQRLSGFLLWGGAYSELYFSRTKWPDFSLRDFNAALREYARRQRRFGT